MGLLNKLTVNPGSVFSQGNGSTPPTPVGATPQSKLQYTYSINGIPNVPNKPSPSNLDLDGVNPLGPLKDATTPSINNSFSCGVYKNCTPEGASF
jgi:hypothetical protein